MKNIGLNKQAEDQTEVIQPEEKEIGTTIVCNSNCQYAQNPEKMCTLTNIALTMSKEGEFMCAQYVPVQEMMEQEAQSDENAKGESQSKKQIGLAGAKTKQ